MAHAKKIVVGLGTCGIAAGAGTIYDTIKTKIEETGLEVELSITGCNGMCHREPLVEVYDEEGNKFLYGDLNKRKAELIFERHVVGGKVQERYLVKEDRDGTPAHEFLSGQSRIVLRNAGIINPESIDEYLERDGYEALRKVLTSMTPEQVIDEVVKSGLRGRGGAGFPTGMKWKFARAAQGDEKYVICNADEGDPGAFMDRSVLEGDPHAVLEGMAIAAYAIGASVGYIYARAEYPLAVKRLRKAIADAEERGFLGKNIFGTDFSFKIKIKEGAGAFVCGEETALMASIEGWRGMPRPRPPYPAQKGLWGKPTNINNVETYANIAWIILNGGDKYAAIGTERSKGTKVFALAGKIKRGGLVEVPMGISIKDILETVGGGSSTGRPIKAVQMGGPSGGCIPSELFDTKIDYEEVNKTGAIMGSGGLVVMDETTCMVDIARFFLEFTRNESCGKCTFCRIGTTRMLELLEKITAGEATMDDLEKLESLARQVKITSLCGLGQTAPNPVLTTLKYFRNEYEAHILDKSCPAGVCPNLTTYKIDTKTCTGCNVCLTNCPVQAITGERGKGDTYVIDESACIRCGVCRDVCHFDAVYTE